MLCTYVAMSLSYAHELLWCYILVCLSVASILQDHDITLSDIQVKSSHCVVFIIVSPVKSVQSVTGRPSWNSSKETALKHPVRA